MHQGLHFISGLPRSGSTLLSAILRQNPRFHAAMSSPVVSMYSSLERSMSPRNEFAIVITDEQRRDVLRGLFSNYYGAIAAEKLVFDTNRGWCAKLPALTQLFPNAKIICCVRSVGWIIDSIERLVRANAFNLSGIFGFSPSTNVYTRAARITAPTGMLGYPLCALKEAFYGEQAAKLILVEYEALARAPRSTIGRLYAMLDEPWFEHDFDHVEYGADEFDSRMGTPGLHSIRPTVDWVERKSIVPPDLFQRFDKDTFWNAPDAGACQVPIIRFDGETASALS
ncbi:MAG: sulfotransferase [bacterium]|nr:sulfotransferase [bacterium]